MPNVWAVQLLRPYMEGTLFTIPPHHDALKWILILADTTGKLAQWRLRSFEMTFDVLHRARIERQASNAVSQIPTDGKDCNPIEEAFSVMSVSSPPGVERK